MNKVGSYDAYVNSYQNYGTQCIRFLQISSLVLFGILAVSSFFRTAYLGNAYEIVIRLGWDNPLLKILGDCADDETKSIDALQNVKVVTSDNAENNFVKGISLWRDRQSSPPPEKFSTASSRCFP